MRSETDILWKHINDRFVRAFVTYRLIEDDDHILVGLSGGKDSLLLLELLARRARIRHPRFTVEALHVRMENIRYETSTDYLQRFCDNLDVPLHLVTTRFENVLEKPQISSLKPPLGRRTLATKGTQETSNLKSK
jgi:tRNA(Ile)-lysidine synthase TilS/MesJ